MDPETVRSPARAKPSGWWILITFVAGVAGSMGAVAAAGHGTYDIPPFRAELRAWPALAGKTEIAVRAPVVGRAHAEAGTHKAPIDLRVTIIGLSTKATASDLRALQNPRDLASLIGQQDSAAVRSFAIKLGLLAIAGGLVGGLIVSLGRWQRMVGGALAGLLAIAVIGVVTKATYNADEFTRTRFVLDRGSLTVLPSSLPTL
jgi:hypothetical protein